MWKRIGWVVAGVVCAALTNCAQEGDGFAYVQVKGDALRSSAACANGLISDDKTACCPSFCGQCGGPGCSKRRGGSEACCAAAIVDSCLTSDPPCRLDADPACVTGITDSDDLVCCPESCGACGGPGCSQRPGGANACCVGRISQKNVSCAVATAPCVLQADPTCDNGILDVSGQFCCAASCGECGGVGCSQRPGGSAACCTRGILENGDACFVSEAPCIVQLLEPAFSHPGLLSSQEELDVMRARVQANLDPARAGFSVLEANPLSSASYQHEAYEVVYVVPKEESDEELQMKADARAAYAQALRWVVTGSSVYAENAKSIMNDWAQTLKRLKSTGIPRQVQLEAAWVAPIWAAAGEIIRHYDGGAAGWTAAEVEEFTRMLQLYAYYARPSAVRPNNWGASAALTLIAVAVFSDDRAMYNEGISSWKTVVASSISLDGKPYEFEEREDCSHAQFSLLAFLQAAEIAWHQGDDLYGYRVGQEQEPRLMKALEHSARLFLGIDSFPLSNGGTKSCDGKMFAGYEYAYNHYKFRAQVPSQSISSFEAALLEVRPDDIYKFFLGWSSLSHGALSE